MLVKLGVLAHDSSMRRRVLHTYKILADALATDEEIVKYLKDMKRDRIRTKKQLVTALGNGKINWH